MIVTWETIRNNFFIHKSKPCLTHHKKRLLCEEQKLVCSLRIKSHHFKTTRHILLTFWRYVPAIPTPWTPPLISSPSSLLLPTVFRRLSTRPPSLLLPRWKVSHPEPRPRLQCWALARPCWPGMEAHTWRVLRTRPQLLVPPACRRTSVGSSWTELSS